ncbi:MAG: hypothetical protein QXQ52_04500, partial [Candidatus Methanomethylicaceae archaeon]
LAYIMAIFWGITMGISETIMRASIADIVNKDELAVAYGIFGMLYGISWSIGGFILTFLLQLSTSIAISYTILTQVLSILMLIILNRKFSNEHSSI